MAFQSNHLKLMEGDLLATYLKPVSLNMKNPKEASS